MEIHFHCTEREKEGEERGRRDRRETQKGRARERERRGERDKGEGSRKLYIQLPINRPLAALPGSSSLMEFA